MWQLLERFSRAVLYRIGRAAGAPVRSSTRKHELLEMLGALPEATLEQALIQGLPRRDLQSLCERIGRSRNGTKGDLAARIVAAMDEPTARSRWRPFTEARTFARSLALKSSEEWYLFARGHLPAKGTLPEDIPKRPQKPYAASGWTNWGDFLGTGNQASRLRTYRLFRQARAYARSLGLRSVKEWRAFCRARSGNRRMLPSDIPAEPNRVYAEDGWAGYTDWLGSEGRRPSRRGHYRSYEDACAFVRALGIRTALEWRMYYRGRLAGHDPRPPDIPTAPDQVYRGRGWVSWGQFFGTNSVATGKRIYRPFAAARAYVRKLGLRNASAWSDWSVSGHRPEDIPGDPARVYRGQGWVSWGDFLGNGHVHPSRVHRRSFAAARAFVRRLGLRSGGEYQRAKRNGRVPEDIAMKIERHSEWKGWADFLGPSYTGRAPQAAAPARAARRRG